jgi:hypothetical protein
LQILNRVLTNSASVIAPSSIQLFTLFFLQRLFN